MPEFKKLEDAILAALGEDVNELSLSQLLAILHKSGDASDDVLIRLALWPLIAQHKIELTPGFNLRVGSSRQLA